jgi:hypothetical protein
VELLRRKLDVGLCALQGHVESPAGPVPAGPVHIAGWCFHSQMLLDKVALRVQGQERDCRFRSARPDVARNFADTPLAAQSGFEVEVDLPPGRHTVDFCLARWHRAKRWSLRSAAHKCVLRPARAGARLR